MKVTCFFGFPKKRFVPISVRKRFVDECGDVNNGVWVILADTDITRCYFGVWSHYIGPLWINYAFSIFVGDNTSSRNLCTDFIAACIRRKSVFFFSFQLIVRFLFISISWRFTTGIILKKQACHATRTIYWNETFFFLSPPAFITITIAAASFQFENSDEADAHPEKSFVSKEHAGAALITPSIPSAVKVLFCCFSVRCLRS